MTQAIDPAGHLKLSVSDLKKSKEFYDKMLIKIGFSKVVDEEWGAGWEKNDFGVWIEEAEFKTPAHKFSAPGIHHFCFKAESKRDVDELHILLIKEGAHVFDVPRLYPEYTKKYYAVFFADPDGVKLELAYY